MHTKLSETIYNIFVPIPNNPLKYLNSYLILGKDRNLLIDTGFKRKECRDSLLQSLDELGVDMRDTDIFLTHLHADHSGLSTELATSDTKIYISKTDGDDLDGYTIGDYWEKHDALYTRFGYPENKIDSTSIDSRSREWCSEYFDRFTYVSEGNIIPCGINDLRVIETPGHSRGHCCLYSSDTDTMFLGDHILFDISPNITSSIFYANPLKSYMKSLDRMLEFKNVKLALPGHRSVSKPFEQRVKEIKTHHYVRIEETYNILKAHREVSPYTCASHMKWKIKCSSWSEFPSEPKWYACGEASAHLEYLKGEGLATLHIEDGKDIYCMS